MVKYGESKPTVLVVDDDRQLLTEIRDHLNTHGYRVATAEDGSAAMALVNRAMPDLVVLDISLSDGKPQGKKSIDGIEVLRRLRELGSVPVMMLSNTTIPSVKVMALSIGADDYVTKPFDLYELRARVDAILRRTHEERADFQELRFQRLRLNPGERSVRKDDVLVELTALEFDILYTLARRPHHVFTRERLLELAWKEPSYSILKVIDVHIGHIRQKVEDNPAKPTLIVTVRGTGYKFEDLPVGEHDKATHAKGV